MRPHKYLLCFIVIFILFGYAMSGSEITKAEKNQKVTVKPGIDVLLTEKLDLISGKRVGLITNPTGITSDLCSTIDALQKTNNVQLATLFGPEHGVRGDVDAGIKITHYTDKKTGIPVYSLYGKTRKPNAEMLKGVDVLLYDIQDIGSRAYTYIYTMALSMEAAKEHNIPLIILDRPNPMGGNLVEGPVLDPKFKSFIGLYPIPYIYGLTVGELANLFNQEFGIGADLMVVPMQDWQRDMTFADTGLEWVPTSPHIPHAKTAFFCASTGCIGELHTINEGVGYTSPFELVGAPWVDADDLAKELNQRNLPGVYFRPIHYQPYYFTFEKQNLQGVQIHILDTKKFRPMMTQINILTALRKLYPGHDFFDTDRIRSFDKAMGTDTVRSAIKAGVKAEEIISGWQPELEKFMELREKYLLYTQ